MLEVTEDEKQTATKAILEVFKRPRFTFFDAHCAGDRAIGRDATYRLADRLLQRERRAGRIRTTPGNKRVWEPVTHP